jgi:predicted phosphohydrolase
MSSGFTELIERYGVETVVYGHLHDKACAAAFEGELNGAHYLLCSADHIGFTPRLVAG